MYEVKSISENGFYVTANSDNADYVMDKEKLNGTTPVGVVNVAISGCAIMCVRGYYLRKKLMMWLLGLMLNMIICILILL